MEFFDIEISIPQVSTYIKNAAIMVVKPGTYSNVTIEYTLHDAVTNVSGTIKRTYPSVTFDAGKNTPVRTDMRIKVYHGNEYYMWDAVDPYWKGYEWNNPNTALRFQPIVSGQSDPTHAPQSTKTVSGGTSRDFNNITSGTASHSAKDCPNLNELCWYAEKGEPYWDNTSLWVTMDHLYVGGMWFLKQSAIASKNGKNVSDLKLAAPNGTDYTTIHTLDYTNNSVPTGIPSNLSDYFYLPTLGVYNSTPPKDFLGPGIIGDFWPSTPSGNSVHVLFIKANIVRVFTTDKNGGCTRFSSSNEDEYRPF